VTASSQSSRIFMDDGPVGGCERRRSYVANVCRRLLGRREVTADVLCARETTGARVRMWYVCGRRRDGHGPFGANSTAAVGHSSSTAAAAAATAAVVRVTQFFSIITHIYIILSCYFVVGISV